MDESGRNGKAFFAGILIHTYKQLTKKMTFCLLDVCLVSLWVTYFNDLSLQC